MTIFIFSIHNNLLKCAFLEFCLLIKQQLIRIRNINLYFNNKYCSKGVADANRSKKRFQIVPKQSKEDKNKSQN